MIQNIYPHRLDSSYRPDQVPGEEDGVFLFSGEEVLCRYKRYDIEFPCVRDLADREGLIYLFDLDGKCYFLETKDQPAVSGSYRWVAVRSLRRLDTPNKQLIFAAVTARHLNDWYRSNRFCGCCGSPLEPSKTQRAMCCPSCGKIFYPKINPVVIIGITCGENILLTRYAGERFSYYALVSGFTEVGESLEETVARSVRSKIGLYVTNIRYYKSQPWGFSGNILAGYFCDVVGDPAIHMDANDKEEAIWMPREAVPGLPDDFSLTNDMMTAFRNGEA